MGQVTVSVLGQVYKLACKDGEEPRLETLARYVDGKAKILQQSLGNVGEARLFLMASLLLADELLEAREAPQAVGKRITEVAEQIEHIAARLENA